MKVSVKKVDALKRELRFEVPAERVAKVLDEVFVELGKVAKVKGFRPGKVPRAIIETQHGELAREETLKKLIPAVYQEGIAQEKLSPLDLPEIQDVEFKDGAVKFTAHIDIKPEIKINNYKGIPVKRKSAQVTEEEINKTLDFFRKSQGKDDQTPLDDDFVKGLGYPTLEDFKKSLSRQMEIDKDRQNRQDVENQVIEALLKETKMAVPQGFVKKQLEHRLRQSQDRLKSQGLPAEEIAKKEPELRKDLQQSVEKDVRVYLILDRIAELEGMQIPEGESLPARVMEFLLKEAKWEEAK